MTRMTRQLRAIDTEQSERGIVFVAGRHIEVNLRSRIDLIHAF